jgi:hypothetical protein
MKKVNRLVPFSQAPNPTLLDNFGGLRLGESAGRAFGAALNTAFGLARAFRPTDAVPVPVLLAAEFSGAVLNHVAALWKKTGGCYFFGHVLKYTVHLQMYGI